MTYTQMISDLTQQLGCKEEDTRQYVTAIVKWLSDNIVEKGQLMVLDFGRFEVVNHKEYIAADLGGRSRTLMPPRLTLHFTPAPLVSAEKMESEGEKAFPAMKELLVKQCQAEPHVAEKFPVAFFKGILDAMDQGDAVEVDQLGEFLLTKVRVGDAVYGKVAFKPNESLAAWVNRPFSYFQPVELRPDVRFDDIETVFPSSPEPEESDDDVFLIYKETQENEEPDVEADTSLTEESADDEVPGPELQTETDDDQVQAALMDHTEAALAEEPVNETPGSSSHKKWWILAAAVFVGLIGLYFLLENNGSSVEVAFDQTASAVADSSAVAVNAAEEEKDTLDFAAMNAEIPYGAYDIVGVDTVITVMKGQDLATISRIFLGTDIHIYLTVLNGGNNEPKEGDHYKIPKLRLRK